MAAYALGLYISICNLWVLLFYESESQKYKDVILPV